MNVSTNKIIRKKIDKSRRHSERHPESHPETQSNKKSTGGKPRVLVCADGGLQAGDLAALLIKDYEVERVMTLPGLLQAMETPVNTLIIITERSPFCQPGTPQIVHLIHKWKTKVLMFGNNEGHQLNTDHPWVSYFTEIPNCQVILSELALTKKAKKETR